jgi:hypothetical protein
VLTLKELFFFPQRKGIVKEKKPEKEKKVG